LPLEFVNLNEPMLVLHTMILFILLLVQWPI